MVSACKTHNVRVHCILAPSEVTAHIFNDDFYVWSKFSLDKYSDLRVVLSCLYAPYFKQLGKFKVKSIKIIQYSIVWRLSFTIGVLISVIKIS